MAKQQNIHVAIVGGGIGGLVLAIGLSKFEHITYTIYESAAKFAEIGAGIGFGSNSVTAMNLISPEIKKSFDRVLTTNTDPSKARIWFDFQLGEDLPSEVEGKGVTPAGTHIVSPLLSIGERQSTCHRAHFLDELIKLLPNDVAQFGKRLVDVRQDDSRSGRKVTLKFADGTAAEADCVVGCDGIRSICRKLVLGEKHPLVQPEFSGKHAYRGLVPMNKAIEVLGLDKATNRQMYLGRHGHILTFPVAKGSIMNVVAFHNSNTSSWAGDWLRAVDRAEMLKEFEGWGPAPQAILNLLEPELWALFQVSPLIPTYHSRRLVLLGDAAHATTPHQGSGAGMAIEDAYILHNLIGKCETAVDIEPALMAYEAVRMPRCRKVTESSLAQGELLEMERENVGQDLGKLADMLDTTTRFVWNVDLPGELDKAAMVFELEKAETKRQTYKQHKGLGLPWPHSESETREIAPYVEV